MTAQPDNQGLSPGGDALPGALNPAAPLRAGADGELSAAQAPEQTAAFERLMTGDPRGASAPIRDAKARVEFEQSLRAACGRCMKDEAGVASGALRAGVIEAMRTASESAAVVHAARSPDGAARATPRRAPAGKGRRWAMSVGASAILVLAGLAVYQAVLNTGAITNPQASFTAQIASFVSTEHQRTAVDSPAAKAKFHCTDFTRVCPEFSPTLGESPALPALGGTEDLAFQGAAPCGVPGGGASVHLRFYTRHGEGGHEHQISLFIQRGCPRLDLEEGKVYSIECPNADVCVWRHGTLVYYLVADDETGCECFRAAAGVGEPSGVARAK